LAWLDPMWNLHKGDAGSLVDDIDGRRLVPSIESLSTAETHIYTRNFIPADLLKRARGAVRSPGRDANENCSAFGRLAIAVDLSGVRSRDRLLLVSSLVGVGLGVLGANSGSPEIWRTWRSIYMWF